MKHTKTRIFIVLILPERFRAAFDNKNSRTIKKFFKTKNFYLPVGGKSYLCAVTLLSKNIMSVLASPEIVAAAENAACQKLNFSARKTVLLAVLAGIYIAMGGLLSVLVGYGFPTLSAHNPGLQKLLSGTMFPLGLILVVFAGAELFTGNNAVLIPGLCNRKYSIGAVLRNWGLVYLGNFAGALFFVYVMVFYTGLLDAEPYHSAIRTVAEAKVHMSWGVTFVKGIGANWFVCLAVWLGFACRSAAGKFIGLWFPVMAFVAMGYEHSIANMFFIPSGMLQGADVSIADFVVHNLIPATLGNIAGGAIFVGGLYWYIYRK